MSVYYFKSDEVKVYPCSYRGNDGSKTYNPKARMITEEGLVGLGGVGGLKSSYVISYGEDKLLDCVIAGYRFKIDCSGVDSLSDRYLCVFVGEDTSTESDEGREKLARLKSLSDEQEDLDANGTFYGIGLCEESDVLDGWASLKAFDSDGGIAASAYLPKLTENGALTGVGVGNGASGAFSTAIGENATALGTHSAAIGYNVLAKNDGQVVVGKHSASTEAQFAVGCGTAEGKKNSFETGRGDGTKINEALEVSGEVALDDSLEVKGEIKTEGAISGASLKVDGGIEAAGTKLAEKEASLVGGAATIETDDDGTTKIKLTGNEINLTGETTVEGELNADSLAVTDGITCGTVTATGAVTADSLSAGTSIAAGKTLTADGAVKLVKDGSDYMFGVEPSSVSVDPKDEEKTITIPAKITAKADIAAEQNAITAKTLNAATLTATSVNATSIAPQPTSTLGITATSVAAGSVAAGKIDVDEISAKTDGKEISVNSGVSVNGTLTATGLTVGEADINAETVKKLNALETQITTKSLNVTGETSLSKLIINNNTDGAVTIGDSDNTSTSSGGILVKVYGKIEANRYNARSDARLKENLREYESEKSILDLPVYKYDYKSGDKDVIGCLAQDLREICPEIVSEGKDGYLSIEESKIVYLLLKEVKKLREEVDELKRK